MSHFQNLRLKQHKGLREAILTELGRMNVICGPNNSGKTTILECIADQKLHSVGKALDADAAARIDRLSMETKHWNQDRFAEAYPRILIDVAAGQPVWFSDEFERFWAAFLVVWQKMFGSSNPGTGPGLSKAYEEEFRDQPSVVLIPAKRKLETLQNVRAFEQPEPHGSGVLNFLFTAKNQVESSPERRRFDAITTAFEEISVGYEFNVFYQPRNPNSIPPPTNAELKFRPKGGSWIQAADCGMGLQEILIILYFALASEHEVVLIEEPENHLHPEIQRRLIAFLREKTQKQFFLSTHSSVFLNTHFADRVFSCRMTDSVRVENATNRAALLTELGYSIADNLVSDLVVLCEGPKDKPVLEEFFHKMGLLDRSNIKVWPLGGDIMDQLDLSVFQESHQLIALIDGDPGSSAVRKRFLTNCGELKIPVTRLSRYSLENYFSIPAIASVMKGQMPANLTELEPEKRVCDQLGFEVKGNGWKIAKEMKLEDIKGTDFEEFLQQVATLASQRRKE